MQTRVSDARRLNNLSRYSILSNVHVKHTRKAWSNQKPSIEEGQTIQSNDGKKENNNVKDKQWYTKNYTEKDQANEAH